MKTDIDWESIENMQSNGVDIAESFKLMDAHRLANLTAEERVAQTEARWAMYKYIGDVWEWGRRELGESPGFFFPFNPIAALREIFDRMQMTAFQAQVDLGEDPTASLRIGHRCPTCHR